MARVQEVKCSVVVNNIYKLLLCLNAPVNHLRGKLSYFVIMGATHLLDFVVSSER